LQNKDGADLGIIRSLQEKGNEIKLYPNSKTFKYRNLKFSQNGQCICLFGDNVTNFEASNGKMIWSSPAHDYPDAEKAFSNSISFSPSGAAIIEVRKLRTIREGFGYNSIIRDSRTGRIVSTQVNHNNGPQAEFSPDGRWIAAGTRNSLKIENWIELDSDVPEWFADFAEVYSGFRRRAVGNFAIGIQPDERLSKLSEILSKIKNNNDNLSSVVKWLVSTSHDRTQSPYSSIKISDKQHFLNNKNVFKEPSRVILEGLLVDTMPNSVQSGTELSTKEGIWNVKFPSTSLSGIFSRRNVRLKGETYRGPGKPEISIKDWGDIEDLPVEGEVILVSSTKIKGQKRQALDIKTSDGFILKLILDFNITKDSESILQKLVGKQLMVFSRLAEDRGNKYKVFNPMDIISDGLPLSYQLDESTPENQAQSFHNSIKTNGETQNVNGTATFFGYYPGEGYRTGFYLLEITMHRGEKVGLIVSRADNTEIQSNVMEGLVGKKISASGRGFKLFARPQILIQSLNDLKVVESDGRLTSPWENLILSDLLKTLSEGKMERVLGKFLGFESTKNEGIYIFKLQLENGLKIDRFVNLSVIKDLSGEKLFSFVGKRIEIFGERNTRSLLEGKYVYPVQVKDARDIKVIHFPESAAQSIPQNSSGKSSNSRDTTRFESANQF